MTNYKRSSEDQRQDEQLKAAILNKLKLHIEYLKIAILHMEAAYDASKELDTDFTSVYSVRSNLLQAMHSFEWQVDFLEDVFENPDTYLGNRAAFLSPEEAQKIKEKYSEDPTDQ